MEEDGDARKRVVPDGGMTMQLDALIDEMEEVAPPPGLAAAPSGMGAPPPLPPKKASTASWILGVFVVLLAAGLGLGAGAYFLWWGPGAAVPAVPSAARVPPPPPIAAPAAAPAEPSGVLQIEAVVFEADETSGDGEGD